MPINRTHAPLALALALSATLAPPAAADVVISSSDPSVNSSVETSGFISLNYSGNTRAVSFTVAREVMLDSVVANLEFESGEQEGVTAQLLELGAPEADKYGTPSYQYTVLGTSNSLTATGNDTFSEQTLSFSGQELDPGKTYLIVLDGTLPSPGTFIDWEYTTAPSSDFATSYGSIISGNWDYTVASDHTSLVYDRDPTRTPELTINADLITPRAFDDVPCGDGAGGCRAGGPV